MPHLDVKEYSKKKVIELYGFSKVYNIRSFSDLKKAFSEGGICSNMRAHVLAPLQKKAPWITTGI